VVQLSRGGRQEVAATKVESQLCGGGSSRTGGGAVRLSHHESPGKTVTGLRN